MPVQTKEPYRYPNELPGFRFYEKARWKSLVPLASTMADVRRVLGAPKEAHDVLHFTEPYPGDGVAKRPVFTYDYDDDWEILVYFVTFCFYEVARLPDSLSDRLCSIDLIPKKRIPFDGIEFPAAFVKKHVGAVDAAWNKYSDGTGLVYEVYTTRTPYGSTKPGDLNRITCGPSDEELRRYASK